MGRIRRKVRMTFDDLDRKTGLTRDDLPGLGLTMQYTDANGDYTSRRVRILRYYDDRRPTLFCEIEADADETRSFLVERINGLVDADGVVETAETFLARFGIEVDEWIEPPPAPVPAPVPAPKRTKPSETKIGRVSPSTLAYIVKSNARAVADVKPQEPPPQIPSPQEPQEPKPPPPPLTGREWLTLGMIAFFLLFWLAADLRAAFGFLILTTLALVPIALIWPHTSSAKAGRLKAAMFALLRFLIVVAVGLTMAK